VEELNRQEWDNYKRRFDTLWKDVYDMEMTLKKLCDEERTLAERFNEVLITLKGEMTSLQERVKMQGHLSIMTILGILIVLIILVARVVL